MIIELYRALHPEDMKEDACGVCDAPVPASPIITSAATRVGGTDMGPACTECMGYLSGRNPHLAPTPETYKELLRRYPEPLYASMEEQEAAEDPTWLYETAWVWRASQAPPGSPAPAGPRDPAENALASANRALTEASDLLETIGPEDFDDPDAYWKACRQIAEAGMATVALKRQLREEPAREEVARVQSAGPPRSVVVAVNERLSEAQVLLSESVAPTEEQQVAELEARQAIADAQQTVARLVAPRAPGPEPEE